MLMTALLVALALCIAVLVVAGWQMAGKSSTIRGLRGERDQLRDDNDELSRRMPLLDESQKQLAVANALLDEKKQELDRLRSHDDGHSEEMEEQKARLDLIGERLNRVGEVVEGAATKSDEAKAGAARIEEHLLGFTKRIANPQSRGVFGEDALRNQLELLGLSEGRDFERQVREVGGGSKRIDYVVHLRGATVGLDPKFALDPDLDEISEALASGDEDRLMSYAKRIIARAKELAAKEYWAHIEHSPNFVIMYVPIEGIQDVLKVLPRFSYEKFAAEHGVYIVTPLQLGTTLGVIADVAHVSRREEELDGVTNEVANVAKELSKFTEGYARHGRQIAAVVRSYNDGAAMLSSRGGVGRISRKAMGFARRIFKQPDEPEIGEVRDDVDEIAGTYRELTAPDEDRNAA